MKTTLTYRFLASVLLILSFYLSDARTSIRPSNQSTKKTKKELYLPKEIDRIPEGNDFNNPDSRFSFYNMVESENVAIFWDKAYGHNPESNPDENNRFDVEKLSSEVERFYNYYVDTLKMVVKGSSLTDKYKMIVIIFYDEKDRTAYGGGAEEKVGMLWTPSQRVSKMPFGALAHELAHSFQYISSIDAGTGPRGAIMEMSAQYMLWQVYPEWMTFENYHLVDFMKQTHYAFLHPVNMYHTPYVLEYWSEKRGKDFFGKLSRFTQKGEDPVLTYKRLNNLTQEQFNDEMFDASRKFITWDLNRVKKVASQYANQHKSTLVDAGNGWYKIARSNCPQNYGYNGIKLDVPAPGTKLSLNFKGIAGADGYDSVKVDKAGWRYGFVASLIDGSCLYGDSNSRANGETTFIVPDNTAFLWLVVTGAPTEHWPIVMRWGPRKDDDPKEEQWPYMIKLTGTTINGSFIN